MYSHIQNCTFVLYSTNVHTHRLIKADFRIPKKWLPPKRGDKYMTILTRRNNFWPILNLLHILMLIVETFNEKTSPY